MMTDDEELLRVDITTGRQRLLLNHLTEMAHLAEQYRIPGTSAWVIVPCCRNGGLDLTNWNVMPWSDDLLSTYRLCRVCKRAAGMFPPPIAFGGKEQYERVMKQPANVAMAEAMNHLRSMAKETDREKSRGD
jgi:hypothetical protein